MDQNAKSFLRCVGNALLERGREALDGEVPFDRVAPLVCAEAVAQLRSQLRDESIRTALEEQARASRDDAEAVAQEIVAEIGPGQPLSIRQKLTGFLANVPNSVRQSLRRGDDPSGTTVPSHFDLSPEQIQILLPSRLPFFQAGDRPECLRGEWVLVEMLGAGGFGEVWKARHVDFAETLAAIKFCLDPTAQERLLRHEAALVNQVMRHGSHPGIVPLQDASMRSKPPWLRYELVTGGDLMQLFAELKPMTIPERLHRVLPVFAGLADTVGYFHRLNPPVVHRDLKPSNILLQKTTSGYQVRIADFGISQLAAQQSLNQVSVSTPSLSMAMTLRGAHTPLYASPQHRRGAPADVRDDVYSLGMIFYQLLVADPTAERPGGKWKKRLADQGTPEEFLELLEECFDDEPDARPANASALRERIEHFAAESLEPSKTPTPTFSPTNVPVVEVEAVDDEISRERRTPPLARLADPIPDSKKDLREPESRRIRARKKRGNSLLVWLLVVPAVLVILLVLGGAIATYIWFTVSPYADTKLSVEKDNLKEEAVGRMGLVDSKQSRVKDDLKVLTDACKAYKILYQQYPQSLNDLLIPPDNGKQFVSTESVFDPWGVPYRYDVAGMHHQGNEPDIWTVTPDGKEIGNWQFTR
jgi:serine/threonine protein kinase